MTRPKKSEALNRLRSRLDERSFGNDSWQVVRQYAWGQPDEKMADRATALVLGSILEQGLELAILSHCVLGWNTPESDKEQKKLFQGNNDEGPMNFGVKIRIAYALGVFGPKTRDDLNTMRIIRNFFAHDRGHLAFDDPDISTLCDHLKWIEEYPWTDLADEKPKTSRERYVQTVVHLFPYFTVGVGRPIKYSSEPTGLGELFA